MAINLKMSAVSPTMETGGVARWPKREGGRIALTVTALPIRPEGVRASPLARSLARASEIDLHALTGSGPNGRIVKRDIDNAKVQVTALIPAPDHDDYRKTPHSGMRKMLAHRLSETKASIPHFYLRADCCMDALLALRAQINALRDPDVKISINDFVIKAVAMALKATPAANAIWAETAMLMPQNIDIAVAIAVEGGLFTPLVRRADEKSLSQISHEIKTLAAKAKTGSLSPDECTGGSFSVSNLGIYEVDEFVAIINPPQSCILAVGAARERIIPQNGQAAIATVMTCTLSVDHRAIDGALAAQLLARIKRGLEAPVSLML